jgi:hypothetical protein
MTAMSQKIIASDCPHGKDVEYLNELYRSEGLGISESDVLVIDGDSINSMRTRRHFTSSYAMPLIVGIGGGPILI